VCINFFYIFHSNKLLKKKTFSYREQSFDNQGFGSGSELDPH
jgi:hypothetical protein